MFRSPLSCLVTVLSFVALTLSQAWAQCGCAATSEPGPVGETVAKAALAGGVIAFAGYRYYRQRSPKS